MRIRNEELRELNRILHGPLGALFASQRLGEGAHGLRADVVENQRGPTPEIAAGVERPGRSGARGKLAARSRGGSFGG